MIVDNPNEIVWRGRNELSVQGIKELLRFDETSAEFLTYQGELMVSGEGIHVSGLDLEQGRVLIQGDTIDSVEYLPQTSLASGGGWKRFFSRS